MRPLSQLLRRTGYPLDPYVCRSPLHTVTILLTQTNRVPMFVARRSIRSLSHLLRRTGYPLDPYVCRSPLLAAIIPLTQTSRVPTRPLCLSLAAPYGHYPTYSDEPGTHSILMFVARCSLRPLSHLLIKNNAATF
jgi:hypothetical protein